MFVMPSSSPSPPTIIPLTCNPVYVKGRQSIDSKTKIELKCATHGANIYYSVNGRQPDPFEKWQINHFVWRYTGPFTLVGGKLCTVKAVAVDERLKSKSVVVTKTFHVTTCEDSPKRKAKKNPAQSANTGNKRRVSTESLIVPCTGSEGREDAVPSMLQKDEIAYHLMKESKDTTDVINEVEMGKIVEGTPLVVTLNVDEVASSSEAEHESLGDSAKRTEVTCDEMEIQPLIPYAEDHQEKSDTFFCKQAVQGTNLDDVALKDRLLTRSEIMEYIDSWTQTDMICNSYDVLSNGNDEPEILHDDKSTQASVDVGEHSSQTDIQNPDPPKKSSSTSPRMLSIETLSKAVGTDLKMNSTYCQTHKLEETSFAEQSVQTGKSVIYQGRHYGNQVVKTSPGRGYWRQQIDHISTQLKTEAYNNLEFQELIAEPCLAQINNVKVHEGLDELVLVISMAIHRPRIAN